MRKMAALCRKEGINAYAPVAFIAMAALAGAAGCAPAFRANLDARYAGEFVWPSPPEKPRISYLWSLYSFAPKGDSIESYLDQMGGTADAGELPYMLKPYGIVAGPKDMLYIVDQGVPRVSIINLKTQEILHLGYEGIGRLQMPIAVAADSRGRIYVTDSEAATVNIFEQSGKFSGYLGEKGFFKRPTGIVVENNTQQIYVLDTAEHKVHVFDALGTYRFSFGKRGSGDGEFNYPTHIAAGNDGRIYVTDAMNFRVQIFGRDGSFMTVFGKQGDTYYDIDKPKGIAVDTLGHIYLVDTMQDMIKIFDDQGRLLLFFGGQGKGPGSFSMPTGISIDDHNTIYIADTYNHRIQAFKLIEEKSR